MMLVTMWFDNPEGGRVPRQISSEELISRGFLQMTFEQQEELLYQLGQEAIERENDCHA